MIRIFLPLLVLIFSSLCAAEVQLGAIYCTTGSQAPLDGPSWRGAQSACALLNARGGWKGEKVTLTLIPADSTADGVKMAVRRALEGPVAWDGFIGLSDTDLALAAGRELRRSGKRFVTSGATSPHLPAQLGPTFSMACFGDNVQAAAAAEWLRETQTCRTVAVLFDPTEEYTRLLRSYFVTAFRQGGGKVIAVASFRPGRVPEIPEKILSAQGIYLAAETAGDAARIIRQLRSAGFRGPIIGGDGLDNDAVWKDKSLAEGVFYTTHAFPSTAAGSASPRDVRAFGGAYRRQFPGRRPESFAGLGRDAVLVFLNHPPSPVAGVTGRIDAAAPGRVPVKPVAIVSASNPRDLTHQVFPKSVPRP